MSNITFATKTPAVYANKRVQLRTFGPADYPVRELIQPALDMFNLELDGDYEGTSANPFLIEAFTAAILAEKLDVFVQVPYDPSSSRVAVIATRFGLDPKVMERLFDGVYPITQHMASEDRHYYLATMMLTAEAFNNANPKTTKATAQIIRSTIKECDSNNMPVLFSTAKMTGLFHLHAKLMKVFPHISVSRLGDNTRRDAIQNVYSTLGMLAAFSSTEIDRLLTEVDPKKYALVGRVRVGFGCKDLSTTLTLINTTHERLLEDMLPVA